MLTRTVVIAVLLALAGSQATAQKSILVSVITDGAGPIRDLSAADFVAREGNDSRQVLDAAHAREPREPLFVSILVDAISPQAGASPTLDVRKALAAFAKTIRGAEPGARISLAEVTGGVTVRAGFDANAADLQSAIDTLSPVHPGDVAMIEAIGRAAEQLTDKPTPRRAIVVVDFVSNEGKSESTMKRVVPQLVASGATVWAVSTRPMRTRMSTGSGAREEGLTRLTRGSGGVRYTSLESSGLEVQLQKIAEALTSQYIVTIARPDQPLNIANLQMQTTKGVKVQATPMMR